MSNTTDSLDDPRDEALLRDVLAEAAHRQDPISDGDEHLDADTLVAYHEGALGAHDSQRARDHIVACAVCAGLLVDLESGFETEVDPAETTLDFERATAWRALRATIGADGPGQPVLDEPVPGAPVPDAPVPDDPSAAVDHRGQPPRTVQTRRWARALAALVLVTVAGLAWRVSELGREADGLRSQIALLETPQDQVDIAYLDAITRDAEPVATVVTSAARPTFLLIVTPPLDRPGRTYRVEILGPSGDLHWSGGPRTVNDHGTLRIALSRHFVPPARYRVRLLDGNGEVLDDRVLRVIDG